MALKEVTKEHYFEMLAATTPAATSTYGFLGEPMGFKLYRGKLAPSFKRFYRWPETTPEFYESDTPMTVAEFRNSVEEYEQDDRDTEKMCATLEWVRLHPGEKLKP